MYDIYNIQTYIYVYIAAAIYTYITYIYICIYRSCDIFIYIYMLYMYMYMYDIYNIHNTHIIYKLIVSVSCNSLPFQFAATNIQYVQ